MKSDRTLWEICYKPISKRNFYFDSDRLLHRKVAIYLTGFLIKTPLTANQMTTICLIIGLVSGVFFIHGNKLSNIFGALLLHLQYLLDHVDGQIARYRKTAGVKGRYYDRLFHPLIHSYIFACLSLGFFVNTQNFHVFYFGLSASIASLFSYFITEAKYRVLVDSYFAETKKSDSIPLKENCVVRGRTNTSLKAFGKIVTAFFEITAYFPTLMYSLTVFSILDLFFSSPLRLFGYRINFVYFSLIFYSLVFPLYCLLKIFMEVNKGFEKDYNSIFQK